MHTYNENQTSLPGDENTKVLIAGDHVTVNHYHSSNKDFYAGFWKRVAAVIVDGIVLGLCYSIVIFVLSLFALPTLSSMDGQITDEEAYSLLRFYFMCWIGYILIHWLYYSLFESSKKQATLGKQVLGIKVTDGQGRRISFARATGRHFAKIINAFTFTIGWIMAGLTERKQGLHDIIADTLVVNKLGQNPSVTVSQESVE